MYGNGMMDGMPMMGGFGWIFMLLFWAAVIYGVIYLVRLSAAKGNSAPPAGLEQTPLDILKSRYAKGEIDKEEYHRIKKELAVRRTFRP